MLLLRIYKTREERKQKVRAFDICFILMLLYISRCSTAMSLSSFFFWAYVSLCVVTSSINDLFRFLFFVVRLRRRIFLLLGCRVRSKHGKNRVTLLCRGCFDLNYWVECFPFCLPWTPVYLDFLCGLTLSAFPRPLSYSRWFPRLFPSSVENFFAAHTRSAQLFVFGVLHKINRLCSISIRVYFCFFNQRKLEDSRACGDW